MLPRLAKPHRLTNPKKSKTPKPSRPRSSSHRPKAISPVLPLKLSDEKKLPSSKARESVQLQKIFKKINEDEENQFAKLIEDLINAK